MTVAESLKEKAKSDLKTILEALGLPVRGSYSSSEVQSILGISNRQFARLISNYEINFAKGMLRHPCALDSFLLRSHRRVTFGELVDFLYRNNQDQRLDG